MHEPDMRNQKIIASAAATIIALACGTNYVHSAWAPQFAEKLKLSATQSNLIGLFGNLGMYSTGPPVGMFIDHQSLGPRPAVMGGAILLGVGYFPLHRAYASGTGSVPWFCFCSFLTGFGSCMAFLAAVKTSAVNWPHHRGTATAFPLAAFGLSAFFFSFLGALLFPGDPSSFLELLSWGAFSLTFLGFFFLKTYAPSTSYQALPDSDADGSRSQRLRRTSSSADEPGTLPVANTSTAQQGQSAVITNDDSVPDETSSLMSSSSSTHRQTQANSVVDDDRSHRVDIRGLKLLGSLDFWQLFSIMTILAGVGLMTINNIGNDANALWKHFNPKVGESFLVHRQQMHVSILSVCSFIGRLLSGIGSDFLVKRLHASRVWCLFISGVIFFIAQACGLNISNPNLLVLVSGLSGLAYGILFGVFPSIVAETFGIRGLSQNWGFMTLAPVISSNVFNLFYGMILDHHSVFDPDGQRSCHDGLDCYRAAYGVTLASCFVGLGVILWVIRHQYHVRLRESRKGGLED